MRWLLLAILLVPSASAASQVHVTYTGDAYAVTFRTSNATASVGVGNDFVPSTSVGGGWRRAEIEGNPGAYTLEGRTFRLASPPAPHETVRVVFVADMGVDANASRIARAIANASPDLVLIGGDLSYAHADLAMWNDWFDLVEPFAASVPTMPAFGNHEHYCARNETSFARCDVENARWDQHFALPNGDKRYYAFDWGPLRVTTLDTEAYIDAENERTTDPEEQEAFLQSSLAGDKDRWDLVMFHRPLRTTLDRAGAALPADHAARLEGMLGASDLVLQAHVHAYERSKPTANGTIHVTSGGGGRELYDTWGPEEPWLASRASVHHFVVLDVSPGRIAGRTLDVDGNEIDAFSMEREVPASLRPPQPPTLRPPAATQATPTTTPATSATPTTRPTTSENVATPSPAEHHDTPLAPWLVAVAVALTAWRRRVAPPSP